MAVKKAFYNIIDLKGNQIQGVGAPSADTDAATKASAQAQANAAQAAAEATAAADAASKAATAKSEAISAAAADATSKAATAKSEAISAAAADATSKANAAKTEANSYTDGKITALVNSAPTTLDTLNELAAALGNDPNFATSITTLIGEKAKIATGTINGGGTSTADGFEYTVNHNLGKANIIVQAYDGNDEVEVFVRKVDNNSLKVITGTALGSTSLTIVVVG